MISPSCSKTIIASPEKGKYSENNVFGFRNTSSSQPILQDLKFIRFAAGMSQRIIGFGCDVPRSHLKIPFVNPLDEEGIIRRFCRDSCNYGNTVFGTSYRSLNFTKNHKQYELSVIQSALL